MDIPKSFVIALPVDEHLEEVNKRWHTPIKVVIEGVEYLTSGYYIEGGDNNATEHRNHP